MKAFYAKLTSPDQNQNPYWSALRLITKTARSQVNTLDSEFSWQSWDENGSPFKPG